MNYVSYKSGLTSSSMASNKLGHSFIELSFNVIVPLYTKIAFKVFQLNL